MLPVLLRVGEEVCVWVIRPIASVPCVEVARAGEFIDVVHAVRITVELRLPVGKDVITGLVRLYIGEAVTVHIPALIGSIVLIESPEDFEKVGNAAAIGVGEIHFGEVGDAVVVGVRLQRV